MLFEISHFNSLLQLSPEWNSQAFARKLMSNLVKICQKRALFCFELTWSAFLIKIWITSNPIFSRGVSLGAKVSISSSYLFSKCDCAATIFLVHLLLESWAEIVLRSFTVLSYTASVKVIWVKQKLVRILGDWNVRWASRFFEAHLPGG